MAKVAKNIYRALKAHKIRFFTIALVIAGKSINLDVEFCDGLNDGYIEINLKADEGGKNI